MSRPDLARVRRSVTLRRVLALVLATAVVTAGATVVYFEVLAYDATPDSLAAVDANPNVTVTETGWGYVVADADAETERVGLVFYPGGRVDPDAYRELLADVVERSEMTVFVPKMPLNLAVLDADAASEVRAAHPEIRTWYVGGHSLGGAMACRYAAGNDVAGVVLFAAYCDRPLPDDQRALVVLGGNDGVLDRERFAATRGNLPPDARVVTVEGMTHAQFGSYGPQAGDGSPDVPDVVAHDRVARLVAEWVADEGPAKDDAERWRTWRSSRAGVVEKSNDWSDGSPAGPRAAVAADGRPLDGRGGSPSTAATRRRRAPGTRR